VAQPPLVTPPPQLLEAGANGAAWIGEAAALNFSLEGLIRDERGVHFAPEAED